MIVEHLFLETPVQHAAAHQPQVDDPRVAVARTRDDADHPVVAEAVDQPHLQAEALGIGLDLRDLGFGVTTRREIELVGLVDQLRDARAGRLH